MNLLTDAFAEQKWTHVHEVRNFVFFWIPFIGVFLPLKGRWLGNPFVRLAVVILLVWPVFAYFESSYAWPAAKELARLRNEPPPDGPNTVAPMILSGWLVMAFFGLLAVGLRSVLIRVFRKKPPIIPA